ncbi:E3 ubiquitin-protein ligase TRIM71-like [Saccoglossus kowalevskii]|uniref:Tripartite motif-containing protein 2-like n=1 Tax=Saccoglossus kowalevskii TaxID=10224 RepID=A0ABM0GU15_SACKO|nr:PREDICTED: tripartite motif-containing protein 2-like [Saccoglossus kowalevskii]
MVSVESKILEQFDDNFLVCTVCSERYRNAKILPCLHSFCEQCIHKLVQKSGGKNLPCPVCRRVHDLPEGASSVQTNVFVNELVVLLGKRDKETNYVQKCGGCQQGSVTTYCIDCAVGLCDNCTLPHKQLPCTKSHHVMSLQAYEAAMIADIASVQPPVYCSSHPDNQLKFYCDSCDIPICLECTVINHKITEHNYRYLNDAAEQYTTDLTKMTCILAEKEKDAKESKEKVQQMTELLENRFSQEEHKLNAHIERVVAEITAKIRVNGAELLQALNDLFSERKQNLHAQMKELEIAENDVKHARDFATNLMNYGNATQLMFTKKGMTSQIKKLIKLETQQDPTEDDYIEFQSSDDFCETKTLGVILHNKYNFEIRDVPEYVRIREDASVTLATSDGTMVDFLALNQKFQCAIKTPSNTTEEMKVTDNKDGTCCLAYQAKVEGVHELTVLVNNKSVQGSPVKINAIPTKGLMGNYGGKGSGLGQFNSPWDVLIASDGNVLVCDSKNNRLQLLTLDGKHKQIIQFTGFNEPFCPRCVAESQDCNYFITDSNNKQVVVCNSNFELIRCFGNGQLTYPAGICINPVNGRVYVVDNNSHYIRIYNQDGGYIQSFGSQSGGDCQFIYPHGITSDSQGNVIVADNWNHRIQVLTGEGEFLFKFGSRGNSDGQLQYPRGVATDTEGYVYVSDYNNNRVQKYDSHGQFVCRIDSPTDGLSSPRGICVTNDKPFGKVVVADTGNNCIKVFAQ